MKQKSIILLIDAIINLLLGIILIFYNEKTGKLLGIPITEQYFYPRILGAVLLGITIALLIEYFRKPGGIVGLGFGGAIAINIFGGIALALFLVCGNLSLPLKGTLILWILVVLLIGVSSVELMLFMKTKNRPKDHDRTD